MNTNYHHLFQNIKIGLVYQDTTGKIIDANQTAEKILGYNREQLLEMSSRSEVWQAIKPDGSEFPGDEHPTMEAIKSRKIIKDVVMGIIHPKTKERTWVNIDAIPEFDDGSQELLRVLVTFYDITEKHKIQNDLIETEKKFQALFENGPIGIAYHKMIYDDDGNPIDYFFLDANDNYQKLTGVDPRGKLVTEAFPGIEKDPADWIGTFARAGKFGETIRFQQYLEPVDRWYDAVGYQSTPDHFVAAFFEVTEQKRKELELERLKSELEDIVKERTSQLEIEKENAESANRAKSNFLANMSHELRTPLNAVLGYAEILQSKEEDFTRQQYLNSISTSGKALLSLINDVLDLSKIETGKFKLQHSPVSIKNVFHEIKIIFNQKVVDKGLHWKMNVEKDVPEWLLLDEMRLRQILLNLVSNALKFTEQGSISLYCSLYTNEPSGKGEVHLKIDVKDTGKGIEKEDLERIFNAFEQAHNQKISEYGGTGLGLSISKNLATIMQGNIEVKSTPGEGAVFSLFIKNVELAHGRSQTEEPNFVVPETVVFKPAKVLIVDDIDYNRDMMGTYLQSFNFEISYANNGKEALQQIEKQVPDVLLLDMKMPVMTGYELSTLLRESEQYKKLPIIAVTASSLTQDEAIIKTKCDGFLRKPVSRVEVVNELLKFLDYELTEAKTTINIPGTGNGITDEKIKNTISDLLANGDMDGIVEFADELKMKESGDHKTYQLLKEFAAACNEMEIQKLLR